MWFVISYDISNQQKRDAATKEIENMPRYWHIQESVWLIKTKTVNASSLLKHFKGVLSLTSRDRFFVARLTEGRPTTWDFYHYYEEPGDPNVVPY